MGRIYRETFDNGPGGWAAWRPGAGLKPDIEDGAFVARSPWRVDANHAPPGGGYLTLLAYLHTHASHITPEAAALLGENRFVTEGYSRDLTNARLTVRLKGEVDLQGSQLILLAQADIPGTRPNFVLTGQPIEITPDWSEQTITLVPDSEQWLCLGGRHDMTDFYGYGDIADVLRDVNVDLIFILFPLTIVPLEPMDDPHRLRPQREYPIDERYLPSGYVMFDTVTIEYPD